MRAGILAGVAIAVSCNSTHAADSSTEPYDPQPLIQQLKAAERSAGFQPTRNFNRTDDRVAAYYRCYFTGKLEIPESYDKLDLREGAKDGCSLDENRYDVFFYPIEAVSSGDVPVTQALAAATPERLATVVPHEDFHAQVQNLPGPIGEAAATLVGFLTGAVVMGKTGPGEAGLFLRKAEIMNRYYDRLQALYRSRRDKAAALEEKRRLFASLERECAAIQPDPVSFNKCVSVPNNAGLAFDRTYTKYYPLLYRVFLACRQNLRCTTETMVNAPKKRGEAETVRYFEESLQALDRQFPRPSLPQPPPR